MGAIRVTARRYSFEVLREEAELPYHGQARGRPGDVVEVARRLIGATSARSSWPSSSNARQRVTGHCEVARDAQRRPAHPEDILGPSAGRQRGFCRGGA